MPLTKATTNVVNLDKDTLINSLTVGRGGGNIASNTAVGDSALSSNTTGDQNTAIGASALDANSNGYENTAVGRSALGSNTTGFSNTAVGVLALNSNTVGDFNTVIGYSAFTTGTNYNNSTAVGYDAQVTGSNQIQLGSGSTTCYTNGAVQNRSDIRDKADIRDTQLGLDFVNSLRPVDFKWDMREDYRAEAPKFVSKPVKPKEDASDEDKAKYAEAKEKSMKEAERKREEEKPKPYTKKSPNEPIDVDTA
jgi:hypothetical protein